MPDNLLAPENDYRPLLGRVIESPTLRVAIVIPVYNRVDLLRLTLAGLANQTYPAELTSIVVADDGSTEDVRAAIDVSNMPIEIHLVRREHEGYGAGQARNLGAAEASHADVLVFFDADCIPDQDAVRRHAVWHHLAGNLVVIGSRHHVDTSSLDPEAIANGTTSLLELAFGTDEPGEGQWVSKDFREVLHRRTSSLRRGDSAFRSLVSSNFSVSQGAFAAAGGFSSDFRRWGGEDTELGWRLWNDGAFFIDEPRAAIYHQTQLDAGNEGWRERSRVANEPLIQSKIPHRHYRTSEINALNETPKVSVVVHAVLPSRLDELSDQILGQRLRDLEVVVVDEGAESTSFIERRSADPRFSAADSIDHALEIATGEFIALVHGAVGLDHRLLSRSVKALETRPGTGWVRTAYGIPTSGGLDIYRSSADTGELDATWAGELPLFGFTRRRELLKGRRSGMNGEAAWRWVIENLDAVSHGTPLVVVPSQSPSGQYPKSVEPPTSLRSMVLTDLKSGGLRATTAPLRAAKSLITGAPYRETSEPPGRPSRPSPERRLIVRYVGWNGHSNLGDEAMLQAISDLFEWADVTTSGEQAELLMLGGGTLINRGYLRHLRPLDSPRIERVVFGPGVANPEYWGDPKEDPKDWIDFLESCLYVGVRGPISADLLQGWGLRREVEVLGDPALALTPNSDAGRIEGRIVVCPAWTRGLLWGESDEAVLAAFSKLIGRLRSDGHDVWVLSAFPGDDRHIIDMMRAAGAADLPYLAAHDDPQTAVDLLASAELAVAERLHGAVLAAAAGTVPIMVEYRPKLRDFALSVDLGDLVIRTDEVDGDALTELTRHALDRRTELESSMKARVEEYRSRQLRAAASIREALD